MNAQVTLGPYKAVAIPGLELLKCGQPLSLDRELCVLGSAETRARRYGILMA